MSIKPSRAARIHNTVWVNSVRILFDLLFGAAVRSRRFACYFYLLLASFVLSLSLRFSWLVRVVRLPA